MALALRLEECPPVDTSAGIVFADRKDVAMKGDFSRDSFDPLDGFTRVVTQQGRVEIDADANERHSIQLHMMRRLAADLIGPHGGSKGAFKIVPVDKLHWDFAIRPGSYYVDGWRIEAPAAIHYRGNGADRIGQPNTTPEQPEAKSYFAYLEVWERHLSALEIDGPLAPNDPRRIADVALGGQDSTIRAQTLWALRLAELSDKEARDLTNQSPEPVLARLLPAACGRLAARSVDQTVVESNDNSLVAPALAYRGVENRLYRVEVNKGGTAAEGASFVWSRENGSVLFSVAQIVGNTVRLAEGWKDARLGLEVNDIVSIEGTQQRLGIPAKLFQIARYDYEADAFELDSAPALDAGAGDVVLRRWDHRQRPASPEVNELADNAIRIVEDAWAELEDGISIRFDPPGNGQAACYRPGDYWLIPARTSIGDILWPSNGKEAASVAPHGIERRLTPVALVSFDGEGKPTIALDLRREFAALAVPVS